MYFVSSCHSAAFFQISVIVVIVGLRRSFREHNVSFQRTGALIMAFLCVANCDDGRRADQNSDCATLGCRRSLRLRPTHPVTGSRHFFKKQIVQNLRVLGNLEADHARLQITALNLPQ